MTHDSGPYRRVVSFICAKWQEFLLWKAWTSMQDEEWYVCSQISLHVFIYNLRSWKLCKWSPKLIIIRFWKKILTSTLRNAWKSVRTIITEYPPWHNPIANNTTSWHVKGCTGWRMLIVQKKMSAHMSTHYNKIKFNKGSIINFIIKCLLTELGWTIQETKAPMSQLVNE